MSNQPLNPPSVRYPFTLPGDMDPELKRAVETTYNGFVVHEQAFRALKQQVDAAHATANKAVSAVDSRTVSSGVTAFNTLAGNVTFFPQLGHVNDQRGNPSYATVGTDNGAKIIVGDSSVVAITLDAGVGTPWFTIIDNDSSSVATLTPSSGTLHGPDHIPPRGFAVVYFDGNFWAGVAPPIGIDSTVVTAPLTVGGTPGYMVFVGGSLISSVQAT